MSDLESLWLTQALKGNAEAFGNLIEMYQTPVYNLCYRMLGDPYDAEDAAQEAFMRAYKGLKRYDRSRSFSTWLLSIAAHYCIDQIRRRRYTLVSVDDNPQIDIVDGDPGPEAETLNSERQAKVQAMLAGLSPQDRAAVVMRYWYDFSYEEIAESLSLTVSAVKSRLHRARRDLAQNWVDETSKAASVERKSHGNAQSPAF